MDFGCKIKRLECTKKFNSRERYVKIPDFSESLTLNNDYAEVQKKWTGHHASPLIFR